MSRPAFSFVGEFEPGPPAELCLDRHYLLCATRGVLRLEAEGRAWTVPPARAALITAYRPIQVTIVAPLQTASVLFDVGFTPAPSAVLSVFDLSVLARALVGECRRWGDVPEPLPAIGEALFRALAAVVWDLAERPSPTEMPTGRSPELRAALTQTWARLTDDVRFEDIAAGVALTPRSLARRFQDEIGMTWRAALRRMRVVRAVELLAEDGAVVSQVGFAVGYESLSAFNAAFRDLTGRTPSQYRASFAA